MLSTRLSDEMLSCLTRLKANPDFTRFLELVQTELDTADIDNRSKDGIELARSQGKALTLAAILELTRDAAKSLMSRRSRQS